MKPDTTETSRTDQLFRSLRLNTPVEWMNGINKLAKHARSLERELAQSRKKADVAEASLEQTLRELNTANAAGAEEQIAELNQRVDEMDGEIKSLHTIEREYTRLMADLKLPEKKIGKYRITDEEVDQHPDR